jgi:hypothetical protein
MVNQSPREQGLVRDHYQRAQQFFQDNPKTTLLTPVDVEDDFEPLAGHSTLLQNGQHTLLVFNQDQRYQLCNPDFNYTQRFHTRPGVSWAAMVAYVQAFQQKGSHCDYYTFVLQESLPAKSMAQLQQVAFWQPDKMALVSVLLAHEQVELIQWIPVCAVRETVRVEGRMLDCEALHADFLKQSPSENMMVTSLSRGIMRFVISSSPQNSVCISLLPILVPTFISLSSIYPTFLIMYRPKLSTSFILLTSKYIPDHFTIFKNMKFTLFP